MVIILYILPRGTPHHNEALIVLTDNSKKKQGNHNKKEYNTHKKLHTRMRDGRINSEDLRYWIYNNINVIKDSKT